MKKSIIITIIATFIVLGFNGCVFINKQKNENKKYEDKLSELVDIFETALGNEFGISDDSMYDSLYHKLRYNYTLEEFYGKLSFLCGYRDEFRNFVINNDHLKIWSSQNKVELHGGCRCFLIDVKGDYISWLEKHGKDLPLFLEYREKLIIEYGMSPTLAVAGSSISNVLGVKDSRVKKLIAIHYFTMSLKFEVCD